MEDYKKWTWGWSTTNAISIYEPTPSRTKFEVATMISEEDDAVGSDRGSMEAKAQLICDAVNAFREEEEQST